MTRIVSSRKFALSLLLSFQGSILVAIAFLLLATAVGASESDVVIRFLNADSGMPLAKIHLLVYAWNPDESHGGLREDVLSMSIATDKKGEILIHFQGPTPKQISFESPNELRGCSIREFIVEDAIKSGILAKQTQKCGKSKVTPTVKPGEIVVLERKTLWWD